jgi:lysozyme
VQIGPLQALLDRLRESEGLRLKPYRDTVGVLTIGYGRNLDHVGISEGEANDLLMNDIRKVIWQLDDRIPWWKSLDEVRQTVIADMAFNLGVAGLMKFKNTLKAVEEGRWEDASRGMLASLWAKQVKGRATRLASMMRTGVYE